MVAIYSHIKNMISSLPHTELREEIGSKSMVSRILNGHRQLSLTHINKPAARFGIPASDFIYVNAGLSHLRQRS